MLEVLTAIANRVFPPKRHFQPLWPHLRSVLPFCTWHPQQICPEGEKNDQSEFQISQILLGKVIFKKSIVCLFSQFLPIFAIFCQFFPLLPLLRSVLPFYTWHPQQICPLSRRRKKRSVGISDFFKDLAWKGNFTKIMFFLFSQFLPIFANFCEFFVFAVSFAILYMASTTNMSRRRKKQSVGISNFLDLAWKGNF